MQDNLLFQASNALEAKLQRGFHDLVNIHICPDSETIIIRGRLPSYSFKQDAQEAIKAFANQCGLQIRNHIEVANS